MPKPKSLQKPVSFLITYREKEQHVLNKLIIYIYIYLFIKSERERERDIGSIHMGDTSTGLCRLLQKAAGERKYFSATQLYRITLTLYDDIFPSGLAERSKKEREEDIWSVCVTSCCSTGGMCSALP